MGKKKKSESLGRALIKDRFSSRGKRNDSMLHTSELNDGYDWGRLNLQSVTEENTFDEFLRIAELAGTEFQAEKLNVEFVNSQTASGVLSQIDRENFEKIKKENTDLLRIPRRPTWDNNTTADALQSKERESFLEWRRGLATLQQDQGLVLTPYEKNLDFWRQLWRVVERSDIVVQIVDARNPLLFRCEDLEKYCHEVCSDKMNFLLLNKADYLTACQRRYWAKYFNSIGLKCAFYSAISDLAEIQEEESNENIGTPKENDQVKLEEKNDDIETEQDEEKQKTELDNVLNAEDKTAKEIIPDTSSTESELATSDDSSKLLGRDELIQLFESLLPASAKRITPKQTTVGLVGYPNVGKSSTINSLMGVKKVSVSATPGKTKHFQTLYVEDSSVMLCDCPGLVFPSMVSTKADMLLSGILPIDQMRDYTDAVGTMRSFIPDSFLQQVYCIMIPDQPPGTHPHSPHTLLSSYAYSRGFMTANGCPDMSRAARIILKDFVNGKLLYCTAPPGVDQKLYHPFPEPTKKPPQLTPIAARTIADKKTLSVKELDSNFFNKVSIGAHSKGSTMAGVLTNNSTDSKPGCSTNPPQAPVSKPWKDHSHKRNKKEKLRRLYRHLDE